jgi:LPXTG-motif cell wall-anchored protein
MALTPSFARRALAVSAAAAAALTALAIPASAHIPEASTSCDRATGTVTLHVSLTKYVDSSENTVKITEGDTVIQDTKSFDTEFVKSFPGFAGDVAHTFTIDVHVTDDQKFTKKWNVGPTELCKKKEQPSSQPSQPSSAPSQPSSAPASSAPSSTTPAAVVASTALADTGASIGLPLAIGALLLIGGIGMLILVRRRRKI